METSKKKGLKRGIIDKKGEKMDGQLKIAQLKLQKGQKSLERPKKRKKQKNPESTGRKIENRCGRYIF